MLTSTKLRGPWYNKVYFLKLHMCVYLRAKSEVSRIILTSFRQGVTLPPPPPPLQNKPLKSPHKLGINNVQIMGNGSEIPFVLHPKSDKSLSKITFTEKDIEKVIQNLDLRIQ